MSPVAVALTALGILLGALAFAAAVEWASRPIDDLDEMDQHQAFGDAIRRKP